MAADGHGEQRTRREGRGEQRASLGSGGAAGVARCLPREGRGAAGTRAVKVGARSWHGGHVHGHPSAFEPFSRTPVTRRGARLGDHFWAGSGSNWAMGLKAKL
jgi:hypothetical protein